MPLRESVAASTTSRNPIVSISQLRMRWPRLEPQVERRQDEQRDDQHDPEVVRVAGHRVRPVDVGAVDRAVDVDLARAAGDRREHATRRGCRRAARRAAAARRRAALTTMPALNQPSVRQKYVLPAPREPDDRGGEEREVDHPLRQALAPLARARRSRRGRSSRRGRRRGTRAKNPSSTAVVRGTRSARRRDERATRGRGSPGRRRARRCRRCSSAPSRTSRRRALARNRKLVSRLTRGRSSKPGELLDAGAPRDPSPPFLGERRRRRASPARQSRVQVAQRGGHAVDVVRRDDDPGARVADQLGRGAVGRDDARGSAARRRGTRTPCRSARPCRARRPRGSAAAAPPSRAAARASGAAARRGSARAGRRAPSCSAHSRSVERKSPRKRATDDRRARTLASAVRNGRGSRLPKNEPACVIRKRSDGRCSRPAKSSKSEPFAIVTTSPARAALAHLVGDRVGDADDRVGVARDSFATACSPCSFARTSIRSAWRCGCATTESRRSATHGMPVARLTAAPTRWTEDGGDVVITTSIPSRLTILIAAGIAVRFQLTFSSGHEQPPARELRLHADALEPLRAVQLLGGLAPFRPEVAGAVHPGERRRRQLVVAVDPLRVVGREHVRLDPELRQVRRELQRTLHAAAPGRREVHRDEEDLHCGRR